MKKFILLIFLTPVFAFSQVNINVQLPPAGLTLKSQLWSILATNASSNSVLVHFEMRLTDITRNVQVMNSTTAPVYLSTGNQFLHAGLMAPVQYNITDPSFQEFAANEFLPFGKFIACYVIMKHSGDGIEKIGEECEVVEVESLSPPQLVFPYHQEAIETKQPVFNWIAPSPAGLFNALNYDLELTEVYSYQTETDAVQQNIPLFRQSYISSVSFPYPAGAVSLEVDKKYAWRILAKNGDAVVGRSETWVFTVKDHVRKDSLIRTESPFAKLSKGGQPSYTLARNNLKFEYLNDTRDTSWNLRITDISDARHREVQLAMDSVKLVRGQNLVTVPLSTSGAFTNKHIYLLEVRNSRNELWQLKFEFRREEETTTK